MCTLYISNSTFSMIRSARSWILSMGILVSLVSVISPTFAGEETVVDGIPVVRNSNTPSEGRKTIHLKELWRVGGEDDELFFGLITQVRTDAEGYIYLLDAQLCEVYVYSPEGEFKHSLFREGDGPGEIREPVDMLLLDDGSVGAAQEFPAVMTIVDKQGNPSGSLQLGGGDPIKRSSMSMIGCATHGGNIVFSGTEFRQSENPGIQERTNFLASFSRTGEELVRYMENHTHYNFGDFSFIEREHTPHFWWGYAVGSNGTVYVPESRDDYVIQMYSRDGILLRIIEREYETWQRTAEEKNKMRRLIEGATAGAPGEITITVEETEPAIAYFHRGLRVARDGSLWVLSSRGLRDQPDGVLLTYDVFDPTGHFVKQVSVQCEGNPMIDGLFIVDENRALLVKGYLDALAAQFGRGVTYGDEEQEPEPMEVICYAIE